VYVQEDQGLNAAVREVRLALGDSAYNPKYVQTIGGLGYRFIYLVEIVDEDLEDTGIGS
jgi:DNA-binding winged helix-turn-helix (wHTH) protein